MEKRLAEATGGFSTDGARYTPRVVQGRIVNPPEYWSAATEVFVDLQGTIWVGAPRHYLNVKNRTWSIEENRWLVVERSGAMSWVTLPSSFVLFGVHKDALFGLDYNDDESSVTRLDVVR